MANDIKLKHYIHTPDHWADDDLNDMRNDFAKLHSEQSEDAAIGEGAGGHGFETIIEFLFSNPIATGIISATIYDIVKTMFKHRPNNKATPEGIPDTYRLVVHIDDEEDHTIIGINLSDNQKSIEVAVKEHLEDKLQEGHSRIELVDDSWEDYGL